MPSSVGQMKPWLFGLALMTACSGSTPPVVAGAFVDEDIADEGITDERIDVGLPPDGCTALIGPEPWLPLFESRLTIRCVIVAEHQDVQIWNKGFDPLTIQWVDGQRRLRSDEHLDTGPAGQVLPPGPTQLGSAPYPMPVIWVLPATRSPSSGVEIDGESFGPVAPGMTLEEASAELGLPIGIDPDLLPGPVCFGAVIVDDPYSPIFIVHVEPDPMQSEILGIETHLDGDACR